MRAVRNFVSDIWLTVFAGRRGGKTMFRSGWSADHPAAYALNTDPATTALVFSSETAPKSEPPTPAHLLDE